MADPIHEALVAFMEASDFLAGREVVERLQDVLLSDEALEYLDLQIAHAPEDTPLGSVLRLKGQALRDSRSMSIGYAFARLFLQLQPEEISAQVAALLSAAGSSEEIVRLASERPDLLGEIQRVVVATQLQNGLQEELMGTVYPGADPRRIDACRMMLRLCDRRIDPRTWATIAGELANAISAAGESPAGSLDEAISLYREVLALAESWEDSDLLANTSRNLGLALAAQSDLERAKGEVAGGEPGPVGPERIDPVLDGRPWDLAERREGPSFRMEDWIPRGDALSLWTELMTVETYSGAQDTPFVGLAAEREQSLRAQVMDGELSWSLLRRTASDCAWHWSLTGDLASEDQEAIVRVVRGETALFLLLYAARGRLDGERRAAWLARLDQAAPGLIPLPPVLAFQAAEREEVERRLALLVAPPTAPVADPAELCRSMLDGIQRSSQPQLWGQVLLLCGLHVFRSPNRSGALLEAAIGALRRALEIVPRGSEPWANGLAALAKALARRTGEGAATSLEQARRGLGEAAQVFAATGNRGRLGAVLQDLGDLECRAAEDAPAVLGALRLYLQVLELRPQEEDAAGWAETTLSIGDACLRLHQLTQDPAALEQAGASFARVLAACADEPRFKTLGTEVIASLMGWAITRLNGIDREGIPEPRVPPGFADRELRGSVLYLRPLLSAGALRLSNRFTAPESFAIQFAEEPEQITLESALYRTLAERFDFLSIAGRVEGMGSTRLFAVGGEGWKDLALMQFDRADLVVMVPHDSPGVRWEVETIAARHLVERTLFVMPPESPSYDVPALWEGARKLLGAAGLQAPEWEAEGALIRFAADGRVVETIPFSTVWENRLAARLEALLD